MKNRIVYLDYLRVFATIAVIILHVVALNWYITDVNTLDWKIFHTYGSAVRWAVPVFVMISGSIFLEKGYELKKIYSKNIFRMFIAFFFWSGIYAMIEGGDIETILLNFFSGHYHMWFVPMIAWLYICIPIIHKIVESEEITKYFLVIAFFFSFLFPQIVQLVNDFGGEKLIETVDVFDNIFSIANFNYAGYFVAGFYLSKLELSKRNRNFLYFLGIVGTIIIIVVDTVLAVKTQTPVDTYGGNFTIPVLMQSIAIFVWAKYHVPKAKHLGTIMNKLAGYSFGVYLIHALVIEQLALNLELHTWSLHPIVFVPVIAIIVSILSFAISAMIHKIPILNKYIV